MYHFLFLISWCITCSMLSMHKPAEKAGDVIKTMLFQDYFENRLFADFFKTGGTITDKDKFGRTILHWAVLANKSAHVQFVLEQGADSNAATYQTETALYYAIQKVDPNQLIITLLLRHGANPIFAEDSTALHELVKRPIASLPYFGVLFENAQFTSNNSLTVAESTKKIMIFLNCLNKNEFKLPQELIFKILSFAHEELHATALKTVVPNIIQLSHVITSHPLSLQKKIVHHFAADKEKQNVLIQAIIDHRIAQGKKLLTMKNELGLTADEMCDAEGYHDFAHVLKNLRAYNFEHAYREKIEQNVYRDLGLPYPEYAEEVD